MYQSNYYSRKKKRSYLWPTLGIALILGIYLGGDLNGWWGSKTALTTAKSVDSPEIQVATILPTTLPEVVPPMPLSTPSTKMMAPDFALPDLFDETAAHTLSAYRGQPVILNFWASWCAPCRIEMPAFQAVYEQHQTDGLIILGINETYIDDADAARTFANEMGLTFPLLRDDEGRISENLFQVRGLPTTVFIRPDGSIAHTQIGAMNESQILEMSQLLIAGKVIP